MFCARSRPGLRKIRFKSRRRPPPHQTTPPPIGPAGLEKSILTMFSCSAPMYPRMLLLSPCQGATFSLSGGIIYFFTARFCAFFLRLYARAQLNCLRLLIGPRALFPLSRAVSFDLGLVIWIAHPFPRPWTSCESGEKVLRPFFGEVIILKPPTYVNLPAIKPIAQVD